MPDEQTPAAADGGAGRESPPDEASFRSPGVSQGAAGHLMGTSMSQGLQKAVDDFTSAVDKLDGVVNDLKTSQGSGGGGFPNAHAAPSSNPSVFPKVQPGQFGTVGPTSAFPRENNGGGPQWTMTPGAYNEQGEPQAYASEPFGGQNGGSGPPPNGGATAFPSAQQPPSSSPTSQPTQTQQSQSSLKDATKPTLGGTLGAVASAAISYGASKLAPQMQLNAYQMQSALGSGVGAGQAYQQAGVQALGTGGGTGNILAQNPSDAIQEWSTLQNVSGTSFPQQTQLGQAAMGATGAISYLNPGISATQAAQQTAAIYNPQSSMKMRMLGYQQTPMKVGGGANDIGQVAGSILSRWGYHSGEKNMAAGVRAGLAPGQTGSVNLSQIPGANTPEMKSTLEGMAQAMQGPHGMSQQQASSAFQTLSETGSSAAQKKSAESQLAAHGVQRSLVSDVQGAQAPKGEQLNDQSKAYAQSLASTTQALANFRAGLNNFFDKSGINSLLGHAGGIGAGASLLGGGIGGGILGSVLGHAGGSVLGKGAWSAGKGILGKVFKGGGSAGEAEAGGEAATDVGADVGADAGLSATGVGLPIAASLAGGQIASGLLGHTAFGKTSIGKELGDQLNPLSDMMHPGKELKDAWGAAKTVGHGFSDAAHAVAGWLGLGGGATVNANSMQEKQRGRGDTNVGQGAVSKQALTAVHDASGQVGTPYVYGKEQPGQGFDCSGLTQWAYKQAGVSLPRLAKEQYSYLESKGKAVAVNKAQEGDLVFSNGPQGENSHVAMLIAHNQIVTADQTGTQVRIRGFEKAEWKTAARPTGNVSGKPLTKKANTRGAPRPQQVGNYSITTGDQGDPTVDLGAASQGFKAGMGLGDEAANIGQGAESASVLGAQTGGITGGSGYTGKNGSNTVVVNGAGNSKSNGSGNASVAASGGEKGELSAILKDIGAPASSANMSSLTDWANREGFKWPGGGPDQGGKYNPLNTEEKEPGSTAYNSTGGGSGVQNYPNPTEGAKANAAALNNGRYSAIVAALKAGKGLTGGGSVGQELLTWSGGGYSSVAAGGPVAAGNVALVGERGPELVKLQDDVDVYNATQTAKIMKASATQAPGGPWAAGPGDVAQYSPYTPAYAGNRPGGGSSSGDVYLNFGSSSIKITMGGGSSGGTTANNTQAIAESMVKHLAKKDMYDQIRQGKM